MSYENIILSYSNYFSYIFFGCTDIPKNETRINSKKDNIKDSLNLKDKFQTQKLKDSIILITDSCVFFIRQTNKKPIYAGNGDSTNNELWIRYNNSKNEELLVECRDNEDPKKLIVNIFAAILSDDKRKIYFMCDAWATSAAIHEIDLKTRKERFICDGNYLAVIKKGKHKGNLIVNQHRYSSNIEEGSYDFFYIVDENGKVIETLGEEIPEKYRKNCW